MSNFYSIQLKPLFLAVLALGFLGLPVMAAAFYTDVESSNGQSFAAAQLQLVVVPAGDATTAWSTSFAPTTAVAIALTADSLSARYDIETVSALGDADFCAALTVSLTAGGPPFTGATAGFTTDYLEIFDTWDVGFTPDEAFVPVDGQTCAVTFVVTAWQDNMTKATAGFRDSDTFTITVTASQLVQNRMLALESESGLLDTADTFDVPDAAVLGAVADQTQPEPKSAAKTPKLETPVAGDPPSQTQPITDVLPPPLPDANPITAEVVVPPANETDVLADKPPAKPKEVVLDESAVVVPVAEIVEPADGIPVSDDPARTKPNPQAVPALAPESEPGPVPAPEPVAVIAPELSPPTD